MLGSPDARALLARHPAIDLHADTLMWARWTGYDVYARHSPPLPMAAFGGHIDLPRMLDGGMGAQFFGLVSLPVTRRARGPARVIHEQIDVLDEAIVRRPGAIRIVKTAKELEACRIEGSFGALLGIEGAHSLEGELDRVEVFARRGVRYLGFLHFSANDAGHPALGRGRDDEAGLTAWGHALVEQCEAHGVLVDLAHMNKRGFMDACVLSRRPVLVSHTGVSGAFAHWRNIDDEQIRAVAKTGGCIGVIFCPRYVGGYGLEPIVRQVKHVLDVAGEDAPALGSDWDGFIVPTPALRDPLGLPLLIDALLAGGLSETLIAKIVRGNVLRVLGEA